MGGEQAYLTETAVLTISAYKTIDADNNMVGEGIWSNIASDVEGLGSTA